MTSKLVLAVGGIASLAGAFVAGFVIAHTIPGAGLPVAHAMSATGTDAFASCTALMDNVNEAFFLLDFETGDLTGGVLNQNTAKFAVAYRQNVLKDLGFKPGQVKAPKFLMVPGTISFAGTAGNRMAQSVLYVTDASTGVSVAYGIPWTNQTSGPQRPGTPLELTVLDVARPRGGVAP